MPIQETLHIVIEKVAANRVNVRNALTQAENTITQADEEAVAAAKVLISKFSNPQGAVQILQNVFQIDNLRDTLTEMDAMIAGLEVLLTEPKIVDVAQRVLNDNATVTDSPLSQPDSPSEVAELHDTGSGEASAPQSA